jgi:hypothetical protein
VTGNFISTEVSPQRGVLAQQYKKGYAPPHNVACIPRFLSAVSDFVVEKLIQ